jgi:hypothetical protein
MEPSQRLAHNLVAESKAYGYTLAIWGAGALLIHEFGTPDALEVGLYIGGALAAIAVLTAVAFGGVLTEHERDGQQVVAASMVHILATGGNLVVSYALVVLVERIGFPEPVPFVLVGFQTTCLYNVFLLFEHAVVEVFE